MDDQVGTRSRDVSSLRSSSASSVLILGVSSVCCPSRRVSLCDWLMLVGHKAAGLESLEDSLSFILWGRATDGSTTGYFV